MPDLDLIKQAEQGCVTAWHKLELNSAAAPSGAVWLQPV
jgi:hypothetical protein